MGHVWVGVTINNIRISSLSLELLRHQRTASVQPYVRNRPTSGYVYFCRFLPLFLIVAYFTVGVRRSTHLHGIMELPLCEIWRQNKNFRECFVAADRDFIYCIRSEKTVMSAKSVVGIVNYKPTTVSDRRKANPGVTKCPVKLGLSVRVDKAVSADLNQEATCRD